MQDQNQDRGKRSNICWVYTLKLAAVHIYYFIYIAVITEGCAGVFFFEWGNWGSEW